MYNEHFFQDAIEQLMSFISALEPPVPADTSSFGFFPLEQSKHFSHDWITEVPTNFNELKKTYFYCSSNHLEPNLYPTYHLERTFLCASLILGVKDIEHAIMCVL